MIFAAKVVKLENLRIKVFSSRIIIAEYSMKLDFLQTCGDIAYIYNGFDPTTSAITVLTSQSGCHWANKGKDR